MPGQNSAFFAWPYVEGLRLDEAMNDLAILATGLYGKDLLPANGAPVRLVVPWKYGFKSIKSIVKIELVADQPTSLWMDAAPNEYGFLLECQPRGPSPALVAEDRTHDRHTQQDRHPTIQRLFGAGPQPVRRDGS